MAISRIALAPHAFPRPFTHPCRRVRVRPCHRPVGARKGKGRVGRAARERPAWAVAFSRASEAHLCFAHEP